MLEIIKQLKCLVYKDEIIKIQLKDKIFKNVKIESEKTGIKYLKQNRDSLVLIRLLE